MAVALRSVASARRDGHHPGVASAPVQLLTCSEYTTAPAVSTLAAFPAPFWENETNPPNFVHSAAGCPVPVSNVKGTGLPTVVVTLGEGPPQRLSGKSRRRSVPGSSPLRAEGHDFTEGHGVLVEVFGTGHG